MLRLLTFVSFSLIATSGFAQQFTDVTAEIGLDGLSGGTVSLWTSTMTTTSISMLALNYGSTKVTALFRSSLKPDSGNCVWADINNDGFKDAFCLPRLLVSQSGR